MFLFLSQQLSCFDRTLLQFQIFMSQFRQLDFTFFAGVFCFFFIDFSLKIRVERVCFFALLCFRKMNLFAFTAAAAVACWWWWCERRVCVNRMELYHYRWILFFVFFVISLRGKWIVCPMNFVFFLFNRLCKYVPYYCTVMLTFYTQSTKQMITYISI